MEQIFLSISENLLSNATLNLKYQNFYLAQLLKLNSKLSISKEELNFKILCNHHQAMTDTTLEYIKNEVNPKFDKLTKLKNLFFTKFILDSYSPKNFPFLDLNFIKYSIEENFSNFTRGFQNLIEDMTTRRFNFTNKEDFVIGETVACTKGKVIFKNHLFELICYEPLSVGVNSIPILMTPACINKYYILDLQQENSMVKWLADNGYQVFMISWVNPDSTSSNYGFEEYIINGVNLAIKEITENFGFSEVHLLGYCLGGLFASISASMFEESKKIKSLTLLTTQLDFSEPNDFSIFLEPHSWFQIKQLVDNKNMMDGLDMQSFFNFIKAKEMVFQYIIDNYFYAKPKSKIDFLAWNGDSTNLTPRFYMEYIESTYINNKSGKGEMEIGNFPVDFSKITVPSFILATINDHIVPWEDAYRSMKLLKNSKKSFVLGGSGHVAGVVNHPSKDKYKYWINDNNLKATLNEWQEDTKEFKGSWWNEWLKWLNNQNSNIINNNYENLPKISDAPGEYIRKKI